jgi:hypothetical protein
MKPAERAAATAAASAASTDAAAQQAATDTTAHKAAARHASRASWSSIDLPEETLLEPWLLASRKTSCRLCALADTSAHHCVLP